MISRRNRAVFQLSLIAVFLPWQAVADTTPYSSSAYGSGVYGGNLTPLPATGAASQLLPEICFAAIIAIAIGLTIWRLRRRTN